VINIRVIDYQVQINTAKKEILSEIFESEVNISKPLLLTLLAKHQRIFDAKKLSKTNKFILDNAVKQIWKETFKTEIGEIFHG